MDSWCNDNCPGNCPASHCICDGSNPETSTTAPETTESSTTVPETTGAPVTSSDNNNSSCDSNCDDCGAVLGNQQQATDAHCAPCATGQTWWPCNQQGLCQCNSNGSTTSAPVTTSDDVTTPETPTEDSTENDAQEVKGYYAWSWNGPSQGPADTNASCFFSGWNTVDNALNEYQGNWNLLGEKYFSIGGGNQNGILSTDILNAFVNDLDKVQQKGFDGVMFDIEKVRGSAADVNPAFAAAFAATKAKGMKVAITVSHSAPYDTDSAQDAVAMMNAFVRDTNVDIISPQLYTSGNESQPDYSLTGSCAAAGCSWDIYKEMHSGMTFVPSIVAATQYDAVKSHFAQDGITASGYFVWQQSNRRLEETLII